MSLAAIAVVISLCGLATSSMGTKLLTPYLDRRRLEYAVEGMAIIEKRDSLDGLSVTHNGHVIERLTKSRIWLWNPTKTAICRADVVAENPLKVRFPGERIFNLSVISASDDVTDFQTRDLGDGTWQIELGHWEARRGVILEALHTSSTFVPKITGSIKGFQPIHSIGPIEIGTFLSKRNLAFRRWVPLFAVLFLSAGVVTIVRFNPALDLRSIGALLLMAVGELLAIVSAQFWTDTFRVPRALRRLGMSAKQIDDSSAR